MKITRTKEQAQLEKQQELAKQYYYDKLRLEANKDCDTCPCCGEKDIRNIDIKFDYDFKIKIKLYKLYWPFKIIYVFLKKDMYECKKCECHWESDWYETGETV